MAHRALSDDDTDHSSDIPDSKFVGAGVAIVIVTFLTVFAPVMATLIYLFVSGYAIVKAHPPGTPSPKVILLGVVVIVTLMAVLLGATISLIGRGFSPPKPEKDRRKR